MDAEKRIQLLIAAIQLFGSVLSEDEVMAAKREVFNSLGLELPEGGSNSSQIELALD